GSNGWRMSSGIYVCDAMTTGLLYRIDWYPGALFDPASAQKIHGELYEVDDQLLHDLDHFEGEEYRRVCVQVSTSQGIRQAWAWEFVQNVTSEQQIVSGDWLKEYHE
ncbi:MAG: Gamma-glutamyl cyclotransferase, AIG2-like, partial [Verrucomicrobiota bacterium]